MSLLSQTWRKVEVFEKMWVAADLTAIIPT
jgi:hypothetical protein